VLVDDILLQRHERHLRMYLSKVRLVAPPLSVHVLPMSGRGRGGLTTPGGNRLVATRAFAEEARNDATVRQHDLEPVRLNRAQPSIRLLSNPSRTYFARIASGCIGRLCKAFHEAGSFRAVRHLSP
jgi:hypothetical protein